ncbi:Crp/Fnr family transcriptional regulator [Acidaminococcus sp. NSJ-142]|jgi:CRP-like cAMP-binding protein|uniref:Crp/Fnr family transcriptional regulator n=1 Tax=Acidaminococcus TaxID=904 RepID=UPI001E29CA97|nr:MULTISPECIES: Crp/Fnr family transcriptional regulator [Acidaminococcus]MCD2435024.1 Crp/Fnr family transcriptional regulator [Acidaminococcus hominis]MCH4096265.1 Crp/Fnr family transcriptional regulator [Acidaminococcus provencensis]
MEDYTKKLQNHALFKGIKPEESKILMGCLGPRHCRKKADEYILRAGEPTQEMGLVLSGSVIAIQEDLWGHRHIMTRIGAGDIFAEPFAAVPGSLLNASVVAAEDCELLFLNVSRLLTSCQAACAFHNRLIQNLVAILGRKTMVFNEKLTHLSKRTTREKLLSYLSSQALQKGSLSFAIPYDRQQLADYLCVERAAMSTELSKLQKEGILQYHKNHFVLKKLEEE